MNFARWLALACSLTSLAFVNGCSYVRRTKTPMDKVWYREHGPSAARGVIVLLPGFGDRPQAFEEHGFVKALARIAPDLDVIAVDAHFGYYRTKSLIPRLEEDVVAPLRARGYRELWLVGTSMGGFGAVGFARTHPEHVRGLLLFAPYMGPRDVADDVARGGLCAYQAKAEPVVDEASFARANFLWLKRKACEERDVFLSLAVGDQDRLASVNRLLGSALDPSHVLVLPGGHGWKVWTPALEKLAPLAFDTKADAH